MAFNPQRAEALRTAVIGTSQTLRHYPDGDAKNLLTEHLALLQEAELIYLTDAFVGEGEEPPIFLDIKKLDEAAELHTHNPLVTTQVSTQPDQPAPG